MRRPPRRPFPPGESISGCPSPRRCPRVPLPRPRGGDEYAFPQESGWRPEPCLSGTTRLPPSSSVCRRTWFAPSLEGFQVGYRRRREGGSVVSPLEDGHDAPPATPVGHFAAPSRHVDERSFRQVEGRKRIILVRVEPGGDHDEVGAELFEFRDALPLEDAQELRV